MAESLSIAPLVSLALTGLAPLVEDVSPVDVVVVEVSCVVVSAVVSAVVVAVVEVAASVVPLALSGR